MERLQAPVVEVVVPASSPAAAQAVPVLVAPPAGSGWGQGAPAGSGTGAGRPGGAGSSGGPTGPAASAAGGIGATRAAESRPPPLIIPNLPTLPGPYRERPRRSLADMANEQLRRGPARDPFAEAVKDAGVEDCVRAPTKTATVGGLLAAPVLAAKALRGDCPK